MCLQTYLHQLLQLENAYLRNPGIKFTTLDIESEAKKSCAPSFQIVRSTNRIHRTRNLTKLLTTMCRRLRDDGVVTLAVLTQDMFLLQITVGLFEGWWSFEDGRELLRQMSRFGRTHAPSGVLRQ